MRKRSSHRMELSTLSELNVTPLLDLAFVLLIIFMITTPLLEQSNELMVPESSSAETGSGGASTTPSSLVIELDRQDHLTLEQRHVTEAELQVALKEKKQRDPKLQVFIRSDRDLPLQKFVHLMDLLKQIGIARVGVMTLPATTTSERGQ